MIFIGQVFALSSVPATTGCYYAVHPVALSGSPAEGAAATLTADTATTALVFVAGGRPPVAGDYLICSMAPPEHVGGITTITGTPAPRWFAERLTPFGVVGVALCSCPNVATTLYMTSSDTGGNSGIFQPATLVYGPTPSAYAGLGMPANTYLSTASFTDQFSNSFRYYFYCTNSPAKFWLTRVYVNSIFGSPFEDTARYSWALGSNGCTCGPPFALPNGTVYSGGTAVTVAIHT